MGKQIRQTSILLETGYQTTRLVGENLIGSSLESTMTVPRSVGNGKYK